MTPSERRAFWATIYSKHHDRYEMSLEEVSTFQFAFCDTSPWDFKVTIKVTVNMDELSTGEKQFPLKKETNWQMDNQTTNKGENGLTERYRNKSAV